MNILLFTNHLNIGGVSSYTLNLAKGLKERGMNVCAASSGGALVTALEDEGISHVTIDLSTKCEFHPKLFMAYCKLLSVVKKNRIDIIHAGTRITQVLSWFAARSAGVSYVSTCHGFFKKNRIGRRLFGAWGDHVIAISEAVKEHLIVDLNVKKEKISLIYSGIDTDKYSLPVDEREKEILKRELKIGCGPVIGCLGRLSPVKGLNFVLLAMKMFLEEFPDAVLLLIGDGPSKESLAGLAGSLGIAERVRFIPATTKIERYMSIMDLFVFYSLEEGLGLSLIEALACGKACIASKVGGVESIIEDNVSGLLVPARDVPALKDAMTGVLNDRKLRTLLERNGKEIVRKKFSLQQMTERVIVLYERSKKK